MKTEAEIYAQRILDGKEIVSNYMVKAAKRFFTFIKKYEYDRDEAERVVNWFEKNLVHWEGEWRGKPFILEPWQKFILQQIFGLKRDGRRLITKVYTQVARKNTKTTLSAGISLFHLFADSEQSPQVLVGANNEDQAKICTTCAANMLEMSPNFVPHIDAGNIHIWRYRDKCTAIGYKKKNGRIEAISRDLKTKDGFNPSLGIIDEYHEADTAGLLNVIRSGQGARLNPLLIVITTAGFKKDGPCYSQLRKVGVEILNNKKQDDSQLVILFEPDENDDWEDENTWKKANPNYGVSVYKHYLKDRFVEAKNEGATKEVDFITKNLNKWTNAASVWIQDHLWMLNDAKPRKDLEYYVGLDIGYKRNWCSAVFTAKDENDIFHVFPYYWIPEETIDQKVKDENSNVLDWIEKGLVFKTPGNVIDHDAVAKFIIDKKNEMTIKQGIADPAYAISIINQLNANNIETLEQIQSAARLTPAITKLYEIVMSKKMRHGGNPVLSWNLSNTMLKQFSSGLILLTKNDENSPIDGISALVNSLVPQVIEKEETTFIAEWW